jgi:nucleoside-diphosphate-sugar epimerase
MSDKRVLLTGAAGKVGRYVAPQLAALGYQVTATDVVESQKGALDHAAINFHACDLTNEQAVMALVDQARPDVVLHTAAIVAPISFTASDLAYRVNVDATDYLLSALAQYAPDAHFVFCSSYTVHGPCAPGAERWDCDTPYCPADDYGYQKVGSERRVREHPGGWTILRIGGVFDAEALVPKHPNFKSFAFMVPLDQREHGVDVRDVVTALVNAAKVCPLNRILMIGGDASWEKPALEIRTDMFASMGLKLPPAVFYRDPGSSTQDDGWYYENWMDTREAQQLLAFQNHSYSDFIVRARQKSRLIRILGPILGWVVARSLKADTPYQGENSISSGAALWDDLKAVYGMDDSMLRPAPDPSIQATAAAAPKKLNRTG